MKPITVNPFIKFGFLISQILLILLTHNTTLIVLVSVFSVVYMIVNRVSSKLVINGLKFGFLLAVFMFIFSLIRYQDLTLAFYNGVDLIKVYFGMIMISIVYKMETSNKELSYVLSVVFSPLAIIGFDQNKLYTLFMMILNQIFSMRKSALRMHKYAKFKTDDNLSLAATTKLIVPFINSNLKHNELLAIGLLNSGYQSEIKRVKPYFITNYKRSYVIILVVMLAIELYII